MDTRKKVAVAGAGVAALVVAGVGLTASGATAAATQTLCANAKSRAVIAVTGACPRGTAPVTANRGPAGARGPAGPAGPVGAQGPKGDSALIIRHGYAPGAITPGVTVNADYCASTVAERTLTIKDMPGYSQSGALEIGSSNSADVPDAYGAWIVVTPQTPANGQTTRRAVVTCGGFDHSESYLFDWWKLAAIG